MKAVHLKQRRMIGLVMANGFTSLRLVCAGVIWYLLRQQGYVDMTTLLVGIFGGFTDFLDGLAARLLNGQSKFGALYDKGVDKVFILTAAFSLYYFCSPVKNILGSTMGYFLIVLAGMESILAISGGGIAWTKNKRLEANKWGKAKMWTEGVALATWGYYLLADPGGGLFQDNELTINILLMLAISLAAKSGYDYCLALPEG
jgi:phosphatidylglycerophosphate synthase